MNIKLRRLNKRRCFQHYKRDFPPITIIIRANTRKFEIAIKNAKGELRKLGKLIAAGPSSGEVMRVRENPFIGQMQEKARQNAEMFREAFKQVQDVVGADIEPLKAKALEMSNKPDTRGPSATDSWRDES